LAAIHLNNKQPVTANEIANVIAYRLLAYKFIAINLPITNSIPENSFRVRLSDAQTSRDPDCPPIWSAHCLAPHPDCFAIRPLPAKSGERLDKNHPTNPWMPCAGNTPSASPFPKTVLCVYCV
jgi:hypothetical protein